MKVLVTGPTGFLGSHLTKALVKQGDEVFCLVRNRKNLGKLSSNLKVHLVEGELEDSEFLKKAVRGMEIVYHLGAISGRPGVPEKEYQRVNVKGTENLLTACSAAKVRRLILTSSVAVTGKLEKIPGDEDSSYNPTNAYERSKVACEKLGKEARKNGLAVVIVRPGVIYGPGNNTSSMAKFFKMAMKGVVVIPGQGENLWDLTYIDDVISGFLLAGEKKEAVGETFILNGPEPVKVKNLMAALAKEAGKKLRIIHLPVQPMLLLGKFFRLLENLLGKPLPFTDKTVQILIESRIHSHLKAGKILGYQPRFFLEEGVKKTVAWYRENKFI